MTKLWCRIKTGGIRRWRLWLTLLIVGGVSALALMQLGGKSQAVRSFVPENPMAPSARLPKLVATFRDVPPDMITYSKGSHSGAMRYVLEEAAARIGYAIQWKPLSFSSSLAGLADGSVDIIPSAHHKTPEREKEARFSVSLGRQLRPIFFALHHDHPGEIKTMADLSGHTIGYLQNSYFFPAFQTSTHFTKIAFPDIREMMQSFTKGELDAIVLNNKKSVERELAALGYTLGFSKFKYAEFEVADNPEVFFLYSLNPQKKEIFDRLDQALVLMKNEGLIADIYHDFDAVPPK